MWLILSVNSISIFLGRDEEELRRQTREIAPQAAFVSRADIKANPDLIPQIEIAYEGLGRDNLTRATNLKWLQNGGAGVNHLPLEELAKRGVMVTNVSGIHARAITEHMFGMLLFISRNLRESHEAQKLGVWKHLGEGVESLYSKTLGILGVGAIGAQAARVGRAFEMKVVGLRRGGASHPDIETMFAPENRLPFFAQCNVVMNVLPLTPQTRGFMGEAELGALPKGAIVINAGRGATIQTDALVSSLQNGQLKAALLDVTDPEPLPSGHILWTLPNVFITPHFSGTHPEYDAEADAIFLDNLRLYMAGEALHHVVDMSAGY